MKCSRKFIYAICILIGLIVSSFWSYRIYVQHEFASELIRFHVIANSDSFQDQSLKLHVRDVVVEEMKNKFRNTNSREEAEKIVLNSMDEIKALAHKQIQREGKDYPVKVMMGDFYFPTKSYGSLTLPAGDYHAVRVIIGEGQGKNWWCVLFPPLCFVDSVEDLEENETARGLKVFEKDKVEFRLKCVDVLKMFS
ncbi:pro-sigma-E processing factor spoIIR [Desulforamulus reducens MI-1]|uniref:Pro-sigma-E processing factor spoIIR n=1 Tax=Desulforamulus reducens (strain ATCC BAA-1160 / DSM 100696 / MI-1) TaxID=349161 RepID=A4J1Q1_DESRM|nr:stage II sporulation protein R [Desulforamulus reducens]ABO49004.1 pro-sigma-E processing factor spoIIR [Desulforamulus reducens MI-1]